MTNKCPRGADHHHAKIDEMDVAFILDSDKSQRTLADMYAVSQQTISNIRRRRTWQHVVSPKAEVEAKLVATLATLNFDPEEPATSPTPPPPVATKPKPVQKVRAHPVYDTPFDYTDPRPLTRAESRRLNAQEAERAIQRAQHRGLYAAPPPIPADQTI